MEEKCVRQGQSPIVKGAAYRISVRRPAFDLAGVEKTERNTPNFSAKIGNTYDKV